MKMLNRFRHCFCTSAPRPWLFVGLGNPGDKYKGTRHNVGFEMIDAFAESQGIVMNTVHCKAIFGQGFVGDVPIFLAKPQTYMNLSGESTGPLAAYYKLPLNRVLLFHDDMNLPCGVLRLHDKGGGHGGHYGLRSVMYAFRGNREFPRLRIGIGRPPGQMDPKAFLLQKFNSRARERIDVALEEGAGALNLLLSKGLTETARSFNTQQKYKHIRLQTLPKTRHTHTQHHEEPNNNIKNKINIGIVSGSGSGSGSGSNNNKTTSTPCCAKVGMKRGPWTPEEDQVLSKFINKEGEGRWRTLPKRAGLLRCGKSCRLRWMNYLRPSVKRGHIAPDEEDLILRLHRLLGNRWSLIAGRIPGRTDNEIKNYWNTHLSKKLISQGIDPRTHKPLNPSAPPPLNKPPCSLKTINPNPIIRTTRATPDPTIIPDEQPQTSAPGGIFQINNVQNAYFNADADADAYQTPGSSSVLVHGYAHLQGSDPSAIANLTCTHTGDQDDEDFNYCSEDVFSSFLNSLINDDAFAAQHHLQQQHTSNPTTTASDDPLLPIASTTASTTYGSGTSWESAALQVSSTFNQNDPKTGVA
ncbi:hypothetical protein FNV43_RR14090 [Rhamnella rubrinervis]|uniref:Uncharacterized protein n=1 Tax=Rhamnella rubrinervis TaxID=2594499 RepID=A0A8K0MG37_9ROSA|nr:hypothetical protein FNV43_RR14090 [Rhamnella rubrinervis]